MTEIPYFFATPVPKYFRESNWFDDENTFKFVHWAFSRCSTQPHMVVLDKREIMLAPYEFVAGRLTSPKECFLTEKQFRGQLFSMIRAGLLKKGANSRANRFTTYIWLTERFCKTQGQQKGQQRANKGPTQGHNQEDKNDRYKNSHHPDPSSSDDLTEDFSSDKKIVDISDLSPESPSTQTQHNVNYSSKFPFEIYPGVLLNKKELNECIAIKGSLESVQYAIEYVMRSPGRKCKIRNWPNTLATWDIKTTIKPRIQENQEMTARLEKLHENSPGWRCERYVDKKRINKGSFS